MLDKQRLKTLFFRILGRN